MIFLIIYSIFRAYIFLIVIGSMLYAPVAIYKDFVKGEDANYDVAGPGLIFWLALPAIWPASCHEMEMRNCEKIEEIEVTCCVDYEYNHGKRCIEHDICIREVCVD